MRRRPKARKPPLPPSRVRVLGPGLLRIVFLTVLGMVAGIWALWDHVHQRPAPMIVFVFDAGPDPAHEDLADDSGLLLAPELLPETLDGGR